MRRLALVFSILPVVFAADKPDVSGDWKATLKTPGAELRLVVHIQKTGEGQLKATLDSVDQGANGIPIASTTLEGNQLKLDIAVIKGSYEGQLSADAKSLAGTWKQGGWESPLTFTRVDAIKEPGVPDRSATVAPLVGIWEGTLDAQAMKLRLRFTLRKGEKDQITGVFDSIDQGANGLPLSGLSLNGNDFHFDLRAVAGTFDGNVNEDRTAIKGTWRQRGGAELPLEWKKVDKPTALNRPQVPNKPYPYREAEIQYANKRVPGVELAGTLTLPEGAGPFPAVVLISGSGPQDRDESLMGHKPFLVLADHLTRKGIAVLRFDDRGVGKSTGNFGNATSADFATDALASVDYLKTRSEIDSKRIGLVGHSEGGMIGPIAAVQSPDVAFLVLIAGPGIPIPELLRQQAELILRAAGKSDAEIDKKVAQQKQVFEVLRNEKDQNALQAKLKAIVASEADKSSATPDTSIAMMTSPWFRFFLAYAPADSLSKIKIPVLAVNGEKDLQVEPKSNLSGIRAALTKADNNNFTIVELPGLNHLLQQSNTGSPAEYGAIEETMNPSALELMSNWILKTTRNLKEASLSGIKK